MSISRLSTESRDARAVVHRDVEVVAVAHELGALARVEDGVDDGRAEPELRLQRVQRLARRRRRGVDPDAPRAVGSTASRRCARGRPPRGRHDRPRSATRGSRRGAYARARRGGGTDGERSVRPDRGRAAGAHPCVAGRAPSRRDGWPRSTPATPRRVAALRADLDYAKWCTEFGESGFATPTWPAAYGAGLSLAPGPGAAGERGPQPLPGAAAGEHHRHRHGRPHGDRVGERGPQAAVPPRHRHQRGDLVPALQRAGRGLRRRRAGHPRRARRRRVGDQRPEGLDLARAPGPLRHAPGPHRPRPAEAPRASATS